jgi:hypothetical protein
MLTQISASVEIHQGWYTAILLDENRVSRALVNFIPECWLTCVQFARPQKWQFSLQLLLMIVCTETSRKEGMTRKKLAIYLLRKNIVRLDSNFQICPRCSSSKLAGLRRQGRSTRRSPTFLSRWYQRLSSGEEQNWCSTLRKLFDC